MCKFSCSWYLHIPHLFIDSLETMWPRRAKSHFLTIVGTAGARLVWRFTFPHWEKSINLLFVTQALNFFKISSGSVQRSHAWRWLVWWKRRAFSHILRCSDSHWVPGCASTFHLPFSVSPLSSGCHTNRLDSFFSACSCAVVPFLSLTNVLTRHWEYFHEMLSR